MRNGATVAQFEKAFAEYIGAKFCVALNSGTSTLHTALVALGVKPGDRVAVPPLTMSATTIAVLHAGAVPVFVDVDPQTWLMGAPPADLDFSIPVDLYGLNDRHPIRTADVVQDAAQTLRQHDGEAADFTSYSFQASKILPLGEGGMLATDDEDYAQRAREFSSLGYRMRADHPRINPEVLKHPSYERHHTLGWNYRMNDVTAEAGLRAMAGVWHPDNQGSGDYYSAGGEQQLSMRRLAASFYRQAIAGCDWLTPQHVPEGWTNDYWAYTVALQSKEQWEPFVAAIERHGGERPYAAWRLAYHEPAFAYLGVRHIDPTGPCPIAEDLQPRLVQCQTNDLASAERNASAVSKAIREIGG